MTGTEQPQGPTPETAPPDAGEGLAIETKETRAAADAGRPSATTYDEALELGYIGSPVDPAPNEDYTVAGVTAASPPAEQATIRNAPEGEPLIAPIQTVQEAAATQTPTPETAPAPQPEQPA